MPYQPRRSFFYNFRYAFAGLRYQLRTQHNARFHLLATIVVVAASVFFGLNWIEWALIVLAVGLVWVMETLNTITETLMDKISPEYDPVTGHIKDLAAAAVLIASIVAGSIGLLVFGPKVWECCLNQVGG